MDYSKYFRTGCDNQEKMQAYFSKCLYNKELKASHAFKLETMNNVTANNITANNVTANNITENNVNAEMALNPVNVTTNPNGSAVNQHVTYKLFLLYFISLLPILFIV